MATLVHKTDATIQQDVINELNWDTRVSAPEVGVSVKNGVVTLSGTVDSWARRHAAKEAAHRVAGVLDVANELGVSSGNPLGPDDTHLARQVRNALMWDVFVPDQKIHTTLHNGVVTLEGEVELWTQREDAERAIRHIAGVLEVDNRLVVSPEPTLAVDLQRAIEAALTRHAVREAHRVHIEVLDGAATLSGTVDSYGDHAAVIGAVRGTRGVRTVHDRLRISG